MDPDQPFEPEPTHDPAVEPENTHDASPASTPPPPIAAEQQAHGSILESQDAAEDEYDEDDLLEIGEEDWAEYVEFTKLDPEFEHRRSIMMLHLKQLEGPRRKRRRDLQETFDLLLEVREPVPTPTGAKPSSLPPRAISASRSSPRSTLRTTTTRCASSLD